MGLQSNTGVCFMRLLLVSSALLLPGLVLGAGKSVLESAREIQIGRASWRERV